jgi:hypothetical protein
VRIGSFEELTFKRIQDAIRYQMHEISELLNSEKINWFYFLVHPKPDDNANGYFDVVFTTDKEDPSEFLPEYCQDTKKIPPMNTILGIDVEILEQKDIAEAWRIIGEQSLFVIDLIRAHSKDSTIHQFQVAQFMHFFMNSLGLGLKSILLIPEIPQAIKEQIDRLVKAHELMGYVIY